MPDRLPPLVPEEDTLVLARRLRIAIACGVVPIILFALFDLALVPRADLPLYWGIKLAALAVIGLATALLRIRPGARPHGRRALITIGLSAVAAMYALSTASAVLAQEGQTTIILSIAVALATATLLPWGVGPQLAVVTMAALSTAIALSLSADGPGPIQYPMVGLVIGLWVSVGIAHEFDRSRRALAARQQAREAAEREVRRLNDVLEARVAARTAELEQVNRALQDEVAERTRYAGELRRSQAAVAAVVENAGDAIWAMDRDLRLIVSNAALRRRMRDVYGLELRTDGQYGARLGEFEQYWVPLYRRGLRGERFQVEQHLEIDGGSRFYVHAFNPIVSDGEVTGLAVFSSDISERKAAEDAARRHQAELTHVLRLSTMGEMTAGIAHELNQPLAAIVNFARGCARRLRADPGAVRTVLPVIDDIAEEGLRAGEIIRRLRQLVRKEPPRQEWFDLNACVRDAWRIVESEARQLGVHVHCAFADGVPAVLGDRIQIEQVALNLLRNALEALSEVDGARELAITTRVLDSGGVELAVRDTGPGMPPERYDKAFEPFTSTKPGGLGMGLSISRTIVESHRGQLSVMPNIGRGVTFHVRLPGQPAPEAMAPAAAAG